MKLISRILLTCLFITGITQLVNAQSISISDTLSGWDQSWVASLNGSQAAYNNWSQGGVSSLSGTGSSVLTMMYRKDKFSYGFRTNLKYGQSNIKGQGIRKTDDVISIRNRFNYRLREDGTFSAYGSISLRSQFDSGFEYGAADDGSDILISDFFAPAYFEEGVGLAYNPISNFTFEAGMGLKQTYVKNDALVTKYGLNAGENFRAEGGITTGINYEEEVFENILYTGTLSTFTNLLIPISETDVIFSNELVGQINSLVSASLQFEMRYDNDFSSELQIKQVLSAGISVNLY